MEKSIYSDAYRKLISLVKQSRVDSGITQEQLAKELGTTQSLISKCERGERRIDFIEFIKICRVIKLNSTEVITIIESDLD